MSVVTGSGSYWGNSSDLQGHELSSPYTTPTVKFDNFNEKLCNISIYDFMFYLR